MENNFLAIRQCLADLVARYEGITTELDLLTRQYHFLVEYVQEDRKSHLLKRHTHRIAMLQKQKTWYSKAYEELHAHYQMLLSQCQQLEKIKAPGRAAAVDPLPSLMIAS